MPYTIRVKGYSRRRPVQDKMRALFERLGMTAMKLDSKFFVIAVLFILSAWLAASGVLSFFAIILLVFVLVLLHLFALKYWQYLFAAILGLLLGLLILLGSTNMAVFLR